MLLGLGWMYSHASELGGPPSGAPFVPFAVAGGIALARALWPNGTLIRFALPTSIAILGCGVALGLWRVALEHHWITAPAFCADKLTLHCDAPGWEAMGISTAAWSVLMNLAMLALITALQGWLLKHCAALPKQARRWFVASSLCILAMVPAIQFAQVPAEGEAAVPPASIALSVQR